MYRGYIMQLPLANLLEENKLPRQDWVKMLIAGELSLRAKGIWIKYNPVTVWQDGVEITMSYSQAEALALQGNLRCRCCDQRISALLEYIGKQCYCWTCWRENVQQESYS